MSALDGATPSDMPGADLVDAIATCERAISHLQAIQAALTAAFSRPGVAGDLTGLINNLTGKRGAARGPDGSIDPDLLAAHQQDYARSLAATEIATALHLPHRTAGSRVDAARELVDEIPATWQALRSGQIDQRRATVIATATRCLVGDVRAAAAAAMAPLAQHRTPRQVQELLDRAVIAADPDAARTREHQARADRHVRHYPARDGIGKVHADLTAEGATAVYTLLDLLAQATDGATEPDGTRRGIDARRADALTDIATELLATGRINLAGYGRCANGSDSDGDETTGNATTATGTATATATGDTASPTSMNHNNGDGTHGPRICTSVSADMGTASGDTPTGGVWRGLSRHGRRPHLVVTIGMSTLAGMDRLPGHLAGHGAITAELALTIAEAYQTLSLAGIDPRTGTAAAVTSTVYRPRQSLSDQIATLAPHCRFPSCRQPAWRSDHDHRVPFNHADPESGGLTSLWDCDPECRRHHLLKTHAHWSAEGRPDRGIVWTSPTGHRYTTSLAEYRIPGEETDPDWASLIVPATWPAPPPEPPTDSDSDTGTGTGTGTDTDGPPLTPSPAMREFLTRMRQHEVQLARFRAVGARLRWAVRVHIHPDTEPAACGPTLAGPVLNGRGDPPPRRRRLCYRDHADQATVERAIRRAAGFPDPNDEPPPF